MNDSAHVVSENLTIIDRLLATAIAHPNMPAVCYRTHTLTYHELVSQARMFSSELEERGCDSGDHIAFTAERSDQSLIIFIAILMADCTAVPLSTNMPIERLSWIVTQFPNCTVLLACESEALRTLTSSATLKVLSINELLRETTVSSREARCISKERIAYTICTSGTTGMPKHVQVSHNNLAAYTGSIIDTVNPPIGWHYLLVSPLSIDFGLTTVVLSISRAGCMHILETESVLEPYAIAEYLTINRINFLKITPSHFSSLLFGESINRMLPESCLMFGGESLSYRLVRTIQRVSPQLRLINHYGPTETTIGVLTFEITKSISNVDSNVPIGTPLPHVTASLFNGERIIHGAETAGELCLGGSSVSVGYMNDMSRTNRSFVNRQLIPERAEERLYRTGDRCMRNPDGTLHFLGRVDRQIKVNGNRVELDEVEQVMQRTNLFHSVATIATTSECGATIHAFVIPLKLSVDLKKDLYRLVATKLPDYMIPSHLYQIDALPLMANGKIDRNALETMLPDV